MSKLVQRTVYLALVGGLILQASLALVPKHPPRPTGPSLGSPLPAFEAVTLRGDTVSLPELVSGDKCSLLVVASTYCIWCQRMRATWGADLEQWRRDVGVDEIRAFWLFREGPPDVSGFWRDTSFPGAWPLSMVDPAETWRDLGILGTPTTYLLGAGGSLAFGTMGDRLPPSDEAERLCT